MSKESEGDAANDEVQKMDIVKATQYGDVERLVITYYYLICVFSCQLYILLLSK